MPEPEPTSPIRPSLLARVRSAVTRPRKPDWYLTMIGAFIGLLTALGAIGFNVALEFVTEQTHHWQGGLAWWTLPLIVMGGALVTGVLVYLFAPEAGGHGVPQVLDALIRRGGRIPPRIGITKVLASIATVGSGGSAGTEGPIIQIGATAGSALGRWLGIPREHIPTMVGCGAAAGISAIFNAPIAGVFFALEILLRDFSLKTFTPIVVASVFATALTQVVHEGNEAIFAFELTDYVFTIAELPSFAVLGVLCAVVAVGFAKLLETAEDTWARLPVHPILKPVTGALLLGLMGIAYLRIAGGGESIPAFFGNGYGTIRALLSPAEYGTNGAGSSVVTAVPLVMLLLVCKVLATSFTLGSRGSGGVFAPSLFMGACTGAVFGTTLGSLGLLPVHGSPAGYALVGMAAVVAGATFAPLTAILLLFELTREPLVLAPIMLAAILATAAGRKLMPASIYTHHLRRAGILIGTGRDLTLLRRIGLHTVDQTPLPREPVYASDPLSKLITLHAHHNVPDFVVVDQDGVYMGMVTGGDMRTALIDREAIPLLLVAELLRSDLPTLRISDSLDTVLDKFSHHDVASLALVDHTTGEPRGLVTRSRVMARYQEALEES